MKHFKSKFLAAVVMLAFSSTVALAYVTPGDLNRLRGLAMTLVSATVTTLTATTATLTTMASTGVFTHTRAPTADSATTNQTDKVALTAPVDTTGTNTHQAYDVALTVGNATGGTNTVNGYTFDNYTGDAQVNVNAISIGTSDGLGTANALKIGSGWDFGITTASRTLNSFAASADSGATNKSSAFTFTFPVDTTGTNTHTLLDMALTAANATGGTNTVNGLNFANYTGDAQVNVNAINIGTSDGLGTANALTIGSGWDAGAIIDSPVKIGATNGTAITQIAFTTDAVANGQTSKTTTLTGVTASSKCVATVNTVPTNSVFLKSAAPGTNQVVVTASADPGASTLAYTVMCFN